ncbi:MAG: hypothetical protein ACI8QZ_003415, partial [Chlamydiales bacterium]
MNRARFCLALPVILGVMALPAVAQFQVQKVFASDTLPQAAFANRVAIAGNWAVVADAERFGGAGGVYIFERT